jgi:hypothetical protein
MENITWQRMEPMSSGIAIFVFQASDLQDPVNTHSRLLPSMPPTKYLQFLMAAFKRLGGDFYRHSLPRGLGIVAPLREATKSIEFYEPEARISAFVLATRIGAKYLIGDEEIIPIRSQTVYVKEEAKKIVSRIEVASAAREAFQGEQGHVQGKRGRI